HLRKKQREVNHENIYMLFQPESSNSTEEFIQQMETEHRITSILKKLPSGCRQVFILSRYENMSYKEIAEQLGISVKTVENQIGIALKILKSYLLFLTVLMLSW